MKKKRWIPEVGEKAYELGFRNQYGFIFIDICSYKREKTDNADFSTNVFKTRKQAEAVRKKIIAILKQN